MSGTQEPEIVPEELVVKFHPQRVSRLFHYILGILIFLVGLVFMIMSSASYVPWTERAWELGIMALFGGSAIVTYSELRRRDTLYIITTWNVRVRKGLVRKSTRRVFFNEIKHVAVSGSQDERLAGQGDVEIYVEQDDAPELVFESVYNPDGVKEIVNRFIQTTPDPVPWNHIETTREAPY